MDEDQEWDELIRKARSRGWVKFCHDGIAVIERISHGSEEKGSSDDPRVSGKGGGEGGSGGKGVGEGAQQRAGAQGGDGAVEQAPPQAP